MGLAAKIAVWQGAPQTMHWSKLYHSKLHHSKLHHKATRYNRKVQYAPQGQKLIAQGIALGDGCWPQCAL